MWAVRWGVLFVGVSLAYCRQTYSAYSYPDGAEYLEYDEEEQTIPMRATTQAKSDPLARIRRYGTQPTRTPEPTTIDHTTDQTAAPIGTLTRIFGFPHTRTPDTATTDGATDQTITSVLTATILRTRLTRTPDPERLEELKGAISEILASRNIDPTAATWTDQDTIAGNNFTDIYDYVLKLQAARDLDGGTGSTGKSSSSPSSTTGQPSIARQANGLPTDKPSNDEPPTDEPPADEPPADEQPADEPPTAGSQTTGVEMDAPITTADIPPTSPQSYSPEDSDNNNDSKLTNTTTSSTDLTTKPTSTTKATRQTPHAFNIDALLDILSNITYDYEMDNILDLYNKTLLENTLPTCPTPTTTTLTTTTTLDRFPIETTPVVAKCFVCGLDTPEIPRNAYCADAFAGDFIPLVPVDASAKGQIARYRKYCRYMDVNNFRTDRREPRSVFGRWTGGCSVRWTDLSGVYTQRACRNNRHAATGRHFGSKRMAKLEMTLSNVKTGCIISPMASLLPLSRGISLFARFHACVCTGSWCNRAYNDRHRIPNYSILTIWLLSRINV